MVADALCAQWCGPRLEPWGAAGRQLSSGRVGRQMWERSPTTIRTQSGPAEQESSYMNTVAQLDRPAQCPAERSHRWWQLSGSDDQMTNTAGLWKEVILFVWQRVSIFKGKANLTRSWLPVSAVTSALNNSQEEPGNHQTARCWCCQTPVVGQFERLERRCCPCYLPATIVRLCAWEWNERFFRKLTTWINIRLSHTWASTII